jgi:hypothetical protein
VNVTSLLLGVAVLGLVVYRQLTPRQVKSGFRVPLVLAVIGLVQLMPYLHQHHDTTAITAALAGSLVLAAGFGLARAATVRLSFRQGEWWSQGTWLTALLWLAAVAAHLGYDALTGHGGTSGVGSVTLLLYLAVTFTVQRLAVGIRTRRSAQPGQPAMAWTSGR